MSVFEHLNSFLREMSIQEFEKQHLEAFEVYYSLSQKWGHKINITANLGLDRFVIENILDPYLALRAYQNSRNQPINGVKIADFGCGGGYVGLIWKVVLGDSAEMVLLDSDRKKINFCKQVVRELGLSGVTSLCSRAEEAESLNDSLDLVASRATWGFEQSWQYISPYLKEGGKLLYLAGKAQLAVTQCETLDYQIPHKQAKRALLCRIKTSNNI